MQKSPNSRTRPSPCPPPQLLQSVGFLKVGATCKLESCRPTILICMNSNDFLFQGSLGWLDIFGVLKECCSCEMRMKDYDFLLKLALTIFGLN